MFHRLHRDHATGKLDHNSLEVRVSASGEEGQGWGESNGEDNTVVEAKLRPGYAQPLHHHALCVVANEDDTYTNQ